MSIRDAIRNNIVSPSVNGGESTSYSLAKVTKADEGNNVCTIRYRDFKNRLRVKENVPVRSYAQGLIDWFPEDNDQVMIEIISGEPIILGAPDIFAGIKSKESNTLESDIYSDNQSGETDGGYIY